MNTQTTCIGAAMINTLVVAESTGITTNTTAIIANTHCDNVESPNVSTRHESSETVMTNNATIRFQKNDMESLGDLITISVKEIFVFQAMLCRKALGAVLAAITLTSAPLAFGDYVELHATADARTQAGSPDVNFPTGALVAATENGHRSFVRFDLSQLPANATIDHAELVLSFTNNSSPNNLGPKDIEVGRVDGRWYEADDPGLGVDGVTWNNQPPITWAGAPGMETVDATPDDYAFNITRIVRRWLDGTDPLYGVAVRGRDNGDNTQKQFFSREAVDPLHIPRLAIMYTLPEDPVQPRPDLGDAPDSSNHHAMPNTAYLLNGVLGQFPTVWDTLIGQAAGPLHENVTGEAILGQYLSREREADLGPDQDSVNNILIDPASGMVADVADNDRGDDGWRNRNIGFPNCFRQTLTVRVSKALHATRKKMYLNTWFDGNRDGDWQDSGQCILSGPVQTNYEWIVQDHVIDMTTVPAGGYLDFQVPTERVFNTSSQRPHWMRFTLSERPAVQPNDTEFPDGRGPHPNGKEQGFEFGETEDVLQRPPLSEQGELIIGSRIINDTYPVPYAGSVIYEVLLRREGGTGAIDAEFREKLPFPLHVNRQIDDLGNIFLIEVESPTGGVSPLEADIEYEHDSDTDATTQLVHWEGEMDPDSAVKFTFEVHVHPICQVIEDTVSVLRLSQAKAPGEDVVETLLSYDAACSGYGTSNIGTTPMLAPEVDPRHFYQDLQPVH